MKIYIFALEEIKKAKSIRKNEDNNPGDYDFAKGQTERWTGKLGQWVVEKEYPLLTLVGSDNSYNKFDFVNKDLKKKLIYEVKTKNGRYPYSDSFQFNINDRQYQNNNADIYIATYYQLEGLQVVLVGWIWKDDIEKMGSFMKKGDLFLNKYPIMNSMWSVDFNKFNPPETLPF